MDNDTKHLLKLLYTFFAEHPEAAHMDGYQITRFIAQTSNDNSRDCNDNSRDCNNDADATQNSPADAPQYNPKNKETEKEKQNTFPHTPYLKEKEKEKESTTTTTRTARAKQPQIEEGLKKPTAHSNHHKATRSS